MITDLGEACSAILYEDILFQIFDATEPARSITLKFFSKGIRDFIILRPLFIFSLVGIIFVLVGISHGIVFQIMMFCLFILACLRKRLRFCCDGPGLSCDTKRGESSLFAGDCNNISIRALIPPSAGSNHGMSVPFFL